MISVRRRFHFSSHMTLKGSICHQVNTTFNAVNDDTFDSVVKYECKSNAVNQITDIQSYSLFMKILFWIISVRRYVLFSSHPTLKGSASHFRYPYLQH